MELKEKLKKLRSERNMSQQALADAIFVSRSAVAKWESGLGLPCDESMEALEKYFEVEKNYFLTDKPDEVIVRKNIKMRKATVLFGSIASVLVMVLSILLVISVMCKSYGLTSKMAAGKVFADNPCIQTEDYDIYYGTIDVIWNEGQADESKGEHIYTFRPVKKLFIGYGVFDEDYAYREIYGGDNFVGRLYSINGEDCYYNILTRNTNIYPSELVFFETITVNGKEYDVTLNSFFVTDEMPQTIIVGETELLIGNLKTE